jgi:hypothetical protein
MALILALALAVPASFASSSGKDYKAYFGDMDTNKDKGVTWDEFKAFFPHAEEGKFKEADLNKDGRSLTASGTSSRRNTDINTLKRSRNRRDTPES